MTLELGEFAPVVGKAAQRHAQTVVTPPDQQAAAEGESIARGQHCAGRLHTSLAVDSQCAAEETSREECNRIATASPNYLWNPVFNRIFFSHLNISGSL